MLVVKLIGIKWQDEVTNLEVIAISYHNCIETILGMQSLKWRGLVEAVGDQRIPKLLLTGESETGKRKVKHLILNYMN